MQCGRLSRVVGIGLCAGGCGGPGGAAGTAVPVPATVAPGPQRPTAGGLAGVDNFGLVTPTLWRGGRPDRTGMASLAAMRVGTIVDLQESDESAEVPPGVRYVHLPTSAWQADQVDVTAVLAAIRAGPAPVFVHCREGRDRTGLAIAAYRLSTGWSAADASAELENFHVNFWWRGPIEDRVARLAADRP